MRLSLRTLLAFEDNVFDVEQHRRLEQLLPADKNAEATLRRIRSIVRNPSLGVPGLVDQQEELDPNYVAEYLDHQMSGSVQEKFETYCLSADKYLAEIASVHHILSNVLGEPARTSRECRLRCYDVLLADTHSPAYSVSEPQAAHFQPHALPQEPKGNVPATSRYFALLWNRLFPPKPVPVVPAASEEKRPPLWTFTILGLLICALLLGWQQIEKQRNVRKDNVLDVVVQEPDALSPQTTMFQQVETFADAHLVANDAIIDNDVAEHFIAENDVGNEVRKEEITQSIANESGGMPFGTNQHADVADSFIPLARLEPLEAVEQVAYAAEVFAPFTVAPAESAFVGVPMESEPSVPKEEPVGDIPNEESMVQPTAAENLASEERPPESETESIIAFQPMTLPVESLPAGLESEFAARQSVQSPLPVSAWQRVSAQTFEESTIPVVPQPVSAVVAQQPLPNPPPIAQMSAVAIVSKVVGRAVQTSPSDLIFSAASAGAPWRLLPFPFDLNGDQYLLTAAPFRGTFELAAGFRIEMIGDAKLCLLPPDASGTPGIFVDYGRIIIHPLRANQPLRIETEKARGTVSATGTESVLFIDTFAEVSEPLNSTRPAEGQQPRTSPILGFVPKNGERLIWKSVSQPQPFFADSQGSVLLQSERYRFGEVRNLPNWLGAMPMPQEDRMLAETCWRSFSDVQGDGERALTRLTQHESPAVRTLGLRLWGDLGRFDVPIAVMAAGRQGEEAIRQVLHQYFEEVMRRDEETVQRLADAIQIVKEAQKN